MDSRMGASANYQMSYFQPASQLIQDEDFDTLILDLTGFKKDQLKAHLTREPRILKISGARQLEDNRWIGFNKDFPVSQDCDSQKMSARFDDGVLFVTMPKLISTVEKEDSKLPTSETQKPQTPTEEPVDTPEKSRERASQKTLASDDQNKQTIAENVAEKSLEKDKTEPSNAKSQEKSDDQDEQNTSESDYQDEQNTSESDDQDEQNIANKVPEKSLEKKETESSNADNQNKQTIAKNVAEKSLEKDKAKSSNAKSQEQELENTSSRDDQDKQNIVSEKSLEKKETESSNAKSQEQELENTSARDDQDKQNIANIVSEKSLEKKEMESPIADNKNVEEKSAEGKYNSIDDDQNANRSSSDKGKEFSSKGTSQNMNSWAKASANASGPVAMLKMARQKMNLVLFVLLAFLIALYVSNLIWYSKKAEN